MYVKYKITLNGSQTKIQNGLQWPLAGHAQDLMLLLRISVSEKQPSEMLLADITSKFKIGKQSHFRPKMHRGTAHFGSSVVILCKIQK